MEVSKRGRMNGLKILAFSNDTGSKVWRLENIANYINARTNHEFYVTSHKNWNGDTLGADIVIAQIWMNPDGVRACKAQGAKVVYETDDVFFMKDKSRKYLRDISEDEESMMKETIKLCDMVTVTTEELKKHYDQIHDNVVVLPNYMDFRWWGPPTGVNKYGEEIRIGWMGSDSHHEDLMMIKPVIKRILQEFPFVKFVYCGYGGIGGGMGKNVSLYKDIFEDIPLERREYYPGVPVEFWPQKSKTLGFDIAIAPLIDDEFNSGKSPIKWMEYSANMTPGVYSDGVVYDKVIKHGVNGFLAKTEEDWYNYLSRLILDEHLRTIIAKQAFRDAFNKHNLEDHYEEWIKAYKTL